MKITCLQELMERGTLKEGDEVVFKVKGEVLEHKCSGHKPYLFIKGPADNHFIFEILNLKRSDYCEKIYGYDVCNTDHFPEAKKGDYSALTRVVAALFCETKQFVPEAKEIKVEVTYTIDGEDVTNEISEDTKANLIKKLKG